MLERASLLNGKRGRGRGERPGLFLVVRSTLFGAGLVTALALVSGLTGCSDGGGVRGTVLAEGKGASGVFVEAFSSPPDTLAAAAGSANSDSSGAFSIPLPAGDYWLTAKRQPRGSGSAGMLYGSSGEEPVRVGRLFVQVPPLVLADRTGSGPLPGGSVLVTGRTVTGRGPLPGATVYLYPGGDRRGPDYLLRARSGEGGAFSFRAPPGRFTVAFRREAGGEGLGSVEAEDLVGEARPSPLDLTGGAAPLGTVVLHPPDRGDLARKNWGRAEGVPSVSGVLRDEEGKPMRGLYAFLYRDYRMVGKPVAISAPSDGTGVFSIPLPGPGVYYLGARSRFGGPVEPGEWMGVFEPEGERALRLAPGESRAGLDMTMKETW